MSSYDPDALECLAAIVEEGGFERAAQRLSITQSAVSQRLRALEAQVGTVLIVRSRPLKATPAGQLLLPASDLLQTRDMSYNETAALAKQQEELLLYRAMEDDIVAQVLRRLSSIKLS